MALMQDTDDVRKSDNTVRKSDIVLNSDSPPRFQKGSKLGRPIASGNRFHAVKQAFAQEDRSDKVLAIFDRMLEGNKREQADAIRIYFTLFPREDKLQHEIAQVIINKHYTSSKDTYNSYVNCPKCSHTIDLHQHMKQEVTNPKHSTSDNPSPEKGPTA